ncbi:ABC transporter ATP-binding protein [Bartonella tamiae]|uniref:ABC transporter domain-containing protein n=1 Tax=Bartonella tamiae Th239 TaxID=1094558 RepID=J0R0V5_9HYPH|nr:ABC transporter ATP-binding protein [Bartonella tamiae]EJF89164.1 hypothetical protein ME5_01715 [Bartonella tamiae Th239]EJF95433.1 hypothetical protein MEG_00166 [Bartonella tamiae Th307]
MIRVKNLEWKTGDKHILNDISLHVEKKEFLGLIGPNGCGKTSLLNIIAGLKHPTKGQVELEGEPLTNLTRRTIARKMALVEQHADTGEAINAKQTVELGRTPHLTAWTPWSKEDHHYVDEALKKVNMSEFATRKWQTLSGGEKQRLHFARALAQNPSVMLLDEPTNHLDIRHQLGLLQLIKGESLTIISALHDLNHAAFFCDRIAVLHNGHLITIGTPRDVLTQELIRDVFQVDAEINYSGEKQMHIRFFPLSNSIIT